MAGRTRLAALLCGLVGAVGGCFIEPATPGTFRFDCSADAECEAGQTCANGLCQQACGDADADPCGQSAPVCLNGYCASVCPLTGDDVCPSPQACLSISGDPDNPGDSGVCTVACGASSPCPDGQLCIEDFGLCVATCMSVDDCGSGEDCLAGFCVPSSSGGGFP